MQLCYNADMFLTNIRILIVVVVIILVGYFTWDTLTGLDAINSADWNCDFTHKISDRSQDSQDRHLVKYFGVADPCGLINDPIRRIGDPVRTSWQEQVVSLRSRTSDAIIRRGIFLDAVTLLTGTFAFLATGKLQSKRKDS